MPKDDEVPAPKTGPLRDVPKGAVHQTIIIQNIEELHLYFGPGTIVKSKRAKMTIDKSQKARNVGIQAQGNVYADNATVTTTEAPSKVNQDFDKIIIPLMDAMKTTSLSDNQALMMNNYINMLRDAASKPKEQRDKGGIDMALVGLKAAVGLIPGLSVVWGTVGKHITDWFA